MRYVRGGLLAQQSGDQLMGRDRQVHRHVDQRLQQRPFAAHLAPIEIRGVVVRQRSGSVPWNDGGRKNRFKKKNRFEILLAGAKGVHSLETILSAVSLRIVCRSILRFWSFSRSEFRLLFTAWISCQASDIVFSFCYVLRPASGESAREVTSPANGPGTVFDRVADSGQRHSTVKSRKESKSRLFFPTFDAPASPNAAEVRNIRTQRTAVDDNQTR